MSVRTRFAPSPTGYLHIGGVRTALFNYLYARRHGGCFVLRIEDTDRERSTQESVDAILDGMAWLGLEPDEGPHYQSRRGERYAQVLEQFLAEGKAYHCYCTREELDAMRESAMARGEKPRYDGRCRERSAPREGVDPVVRFRTPTQGEVVVDDAVRGRVTFSNAELDDLIIARSDGSPTYNFTVVIDDFDMGMDWVIRGDDHLNNTPRQIHMLRALGAEPPRYAHVPMILGADGKRLSKRHGAVSVTQYREEGYLPQALLNYLVRLGWSHGDQELFSREEMVRLFDIADVNHAASTFNPDKLLWLNQQYLQALPAQELVEQVRPFVAAAGYDPASVPDLLLVVRSQQGRARTLVEMVSNSAWAFEEPPAYDDKAARKHFGDDAPELLDAIHECLAAASQWQGEALHEALQALGEARQLKLGKIAQPLRVALTGSAASPSIDVTLELVGRERTLARLQRASAWCRSRAQARPEP